MPPFRSVIGLNHRKGQRIPGDDYHPGLINRSIVILLWHMIGNFNSTRVDVMWLIRHLIRQFMTSRQSITACSLLRLLLLRISYLTTLSPKM